MKAIRILPGVCFLIGVFLIAGAIGADDAAVLAHQAHTIDYRSIIVGLCACVPFILFGGVYGT